MAPMPKGTDVLAPPSPLTSFIATNSRTTPPPAASSSSKYSFSCSSPRLISTPHRGNPKMPSHLHSNLGLPRPSLPIKHKALEESLGLESTL